MTSPIDPATPLAGGLTALQLACMQVVQEMTDLSGGVSPSYADLARELDLTSRSHIHRLVMRLEARGFISRLPYCARSITILRRVPMPDFAALEPALADGRDG